MSEVNIKALEKAFDGDLDLVLFFLAWIKNGRNASKAYKELNPSVDPASARVLGSRQLAKVNIKAIMETYGVGIEEYFKQLSEGHQAMKWNDFTGEREPDHKVRGDYSKRIGMLLGIEKGGQETSPLTQNNYYNLTDEQLDQLIESKRKQTGATEIITGEGEKDSIQPIEVRQES
jgi:hypothetical protein